MIVRRRAWIGIALGLVATPVAFYGAWQYRDELVEKRVAVVVPGKIIRGAWQRPGPLRRILARERIKTVVTLSAINTDDPKYVDQARVLKQAGIDWVILPIHGSYATLDQMATAVELISDPSRQPVFYHCVAGHHRSSQTQAAYRIEHDGWTADRAWAEVSALPWAKPTTDSEDRKLIEAFASRKDRTDATAMAPDPRHPADPGGY